MICCTKFSINPMKNLSLTEIMLSTHLQAIGIEFTQYTNLKETIFWVNLYFTGFTLKSQWLQTEDFTRGKGLKRTFGLFFKKIRQK